MFRLRVFKFLDINITFYTSPDVTHASGALIHQSNILFDFRETTVNSERTAKSLEHHHRLAKAVSMDHQLTVCQTMDLSKRTIEFSSPIRVALILCTHKGLFIDSLLCVPVFYEYSITFLVIKLLIFFRSFRLPFNLYYTCTELNKLFSNVF